MGANMPKMIGPETTGFNGAAGYTPGQYLSALSDHSRIYGYAHHLYNINAGDNPDAYVSAMASFKHNWGSKPLFQTEYEKATANWPDALNMALLLHNALTVEEVAAYLYWDLFWGSGGLISLQSSNYTINNDYYGFKHFSAFIHSGWQRVGASVSTTNLRVSAYVNPLGSKMTVVLINTDSDNAMQSTFDFSGITAMTGQVFRTSSSENCVSVGPFNPAVPMTIPPRSVVTLELDVVIAPQTCQQVQDYGYRLPEDLDADCQVAWTDLMLMADQWLSVHPSAANSTFSPDIAVNGKVDVSDLAMLMAQWLTCNDPTTADCIANWIDN
jgi:glucuronoarabinoxylan endo-1,4-beta-xylanase